MKLAQRGDSAVHDRGVRPPLDRTERLVIVLIVMIGAAIRLYGIDAQSVWYDEAFSVAHSVRPLPELFDVLKLDVVHPPLHYLVLHGWFQLVGYGAMEARLVSAIFGTLSIPLLFLLARRFTNSSASLLAAFLLAISQIAVYFSQEARPYAQVQFLSLLAALAFLWFLEKPSFRRSLFFFGVSLALLYTHYYRTGTLLALGLYWLVFRQEYSPLVFRRLAAVVMLLALAFVPWIVTVESGGRIEPERLVNRNRHSSKRPNLTSPVGALNRFNNGKFESIEAPTTLPQALLGLVLFSLPAAAALWYTWRQGPQGVVLGLLMSSIPVGMAILLGFLGIHFSYRHFSFAVPGYYLAVAIGWQLCLRTRTAKSMWLAIVIGVSAFALRANHVTTKEDYRAGFLPMAKSYRAGDCVTARPRIWNNRIHLGWESYYRDPGSLRLVHFDDVPTAYVGCERLWVVWDRTWWMNLDQQAEREQDVAIESLNEHYALVEHYEHPAIMLQLMERHQGTARE